MCAVKSAGPLRVQVLPGSWFVPPGSNRSGGGLLNEAAPRQKTDKTVFVQRDKVGPSRLGGVMMTPLRQLDATVLFDSLVDRASVPFGKAIAHKVVVDPHEPADYPAFIVPPPHHRFHLAWRVVLVPHARENRHFSKIPTRAWIVSSTAGVGLKMYSVYRAREFLVDS
jgi:hypothetical protein